MCHQKIEQYDDALENYKKAIHYEPTNGRFLYHRAYIYSLLEQNEEAIMDFTAAIENLINTDIEKFRVRLG